MIDPHKEELVPANDVPQVVPKRRGKPIHLSTVYRWFNNGIRGVRLEWLQIGGQRCTSKEALRRFFRNLSGHDPDMPDLDGGGAAVCPAPEPRPKAPAGSAMALRAQHKVADAVREALSMPLRPIPALTTV